MIATGHIENNIIVLDQKIDMPDGAKVRISVTPMDIDLATELCGAWQDDRSPEEIVEDIMSARTSSREA